MASRSQHKTFPRRIPPPSRSLRGEVIVQVSLLGFQIFNVFRPPHSSHRTCDSDPSDRFPMDHANASSSTSIRPQKNGGSQMAGCAPEFRQHFALSHLGNANSHCCRTTSLREALVRTRTHEHPLLPRSFRLHGRQIWRG